MINLSTLAAPLAIEDLSYKALFTDFKDRFQAFWDAERALNANLPAYNVGALETDPVTIVYQAAAYIRLLDRQRVNDAVKALLPAFAKGADLDALVARNAVVRLTVIEATGADPAVMESDANLLNRYLLSFDRGAAGTRDRYLFEAHTAVPVIPVGGAFVAGWREHGRRGDVDIVACGPDGRDLTEAELSDLRVGVLADSVVPEASSAAVKPAIRFEYQVEQKIIIRRGPSPAVVAADVEARIRELTDERTIINGTVPRDFIAGAAHGPNVVKAITTSPMVDIEADAYTVPVCTEITITVEVAS
tara:strand:+ start:1228 stop:2139 length:912 start_codon:yes stop_codon:yes gene_type:complete